MLDIICRAILTPLVNPVWLWRWCHQRISPKTLNRGSKMIFYLVSRELFMQVCQRLVNSLAFFEKIDSYRSGTNTSFRDVGESTDLASNNTCRWDSPCCECHNTNYSVDISRMPARPGRGNALPMKSTYDSI